MRPTDEHPAGETSEQSSNEGTSLLEAWDRGEIRDQVETSGELPIPSPPPVDPDLPTDPVETEPAPTETPVRDLEPDSAPPQPEAPPVPAPPTDEVVATTATRPSEITASAADAPPRPNRKERRAAAAAARDAAQAAAGGTPPADGAEPAPTSTPATAAAEQATPSAAQRTADQPASDRRTTEQRPTTGQPADAAVRPTGDEEPTTSFAELGLAPELLRSIEAVGYEEPTPIQLAVIPTLLRGRDVIAQAQTGSGKTAAFGLPIIEAIDPRQRQVQALILCPTRELAIQVAEALHKYGRHKEVDTLPIYGGQPYERQFRGLQRGVHVVVGTPGRVMDHMRRGTLQLDAIRFFVLDEADEMLDMGFIEDIEWILEQAPAQRQTALFSATMPPRIADLAGRYLSQPARISVAGKQMTVPETRQSFYEIPRSRKVDALTRILDAETPSLAMIFCRTKLGVDELGEALMARGYAVETLHGDLSQAQRDRVMRRFRSGQADILIATDVAARGLDIPDVSHVVNFDIPESAEAYVHRIGRTGRAGKTGEAITIITPREARWLRVIERTIRARIEPRRLPTVADVAERRRETMKQQVIAVLDRDEGYAQYLETVGDLTEEHDALEVAAAILKLYADETGRGAPADLQEDDVATAGAIAASAGRGEAGMTRLFLNVGRNQGVRPQDIVGAIANEADIPGRSIGAIDIFDAYTLVDVPQQYVDRVLGALRTATIKGRRVAAEIAQPGAGGGRPRDDRPRGDRPPRFTRTGGPSRPPRRELRVGGARVERDTDRPLPRDEGRPPRFRDRDRPPGREPTRNGRRSRRDD